MKIALRLLILVSIVALVIVIPTTWVALANQEIGGNPYNANLLVSGLNTGQLDPGEEYWYAYSRLDLGDMAYNSLILSLNFEAEGRAVANRVNFQVLTFAQVEAWLKDSSTVESLGLGTAATADFDANTGERFWSGTVAPNEVYYVRIFNLSPSPVQFRLTALGQNNPQLDTFMNIDTGVSVAESAVLPAAANLPELAAVPEAQPQAIPVQPYDSAGPMDTAWLLVAEAIDSMPPQEAAAWLMSAARMGWLPSSGGAAVPVNPDEGNPIVEVDDGNNSDIAPVAAETEVAEIPPAAPIDPNAGHNIYPNQPLDLVEGPNTGRMAPNTERWYTFTPGKVDDQLIENYSLTMFFTPGEPNLARDVTFEMFTGAQYQIWERGTPDDMQNFGAGSWVSRDTDYNTGERLWHGTVVDGDKYFVKLVNNTDQWVDYHLITGDIINTEMGPRTAPPVIAPATASASPGASIAEPLPIGMGHTTGKLDAGTEIWYRFERKSYATTAFEFRDYRIELAHTPGAGYVRNHVNFDIFPYQMQHIWQRGDTDQIQNLGAGSLKYDEDTNSHVWIWDGNLVSNTVYFIRVRNGSVEPIDYDLLVQGW